MDEVLDLSASVKKRFKADDSLVPQLATPSPPDSSASPLPLMQQLNVKIERVLPDSSSPADFSSTDDTTSSSLSVGSSSHTSCIESHQIEASIASSLASLTSSELISKISSMEMLTKLASSRGTAVSHPNPLTSLPLSSVTTNSLSTSISPSAAEILAAAIQSAAKLPSSLQASPSGILKSALQHSATPPEMAGVNTEGLISSPVTAYLVSRKRKNEQYANADKKETIPIPEEQKDYSYWERRRKNNEAAKRSRNTRRQKEEAIAMRAAFLEQENLKLRAQVQLLKNETAKLQYMLYARPC